MSMKTQYRASSLLTLLLDFHPFIRYERFRLFHKLSVKVKAVSPTVFNSIFMTCSYCLVLLVVPVVAAAV